MKGVINFYRIVGLVALIFMAIFFLYPLCLIFFQSLYKGQNFTLDNYTALFENKMYLLTLWRTLYTAIISTIITLIIGYTLAYFIVKVKQPFQGYLLIITILPMFISLIIRLYGWIILLNSDGFISNIYEKVFNQETILFSSVSVIIGIVHYILPFVVLNMYTTLKKVEPSLIDASITLGETPFNTFWKIIFPLSLPGVFASASVSFTLAASTFLVPILLGGPSNGMLANLVYTLVVNLGNIGMGASVSILLLIIVLFVLIILGALERKYDNA
ncbi:hypothetical protein CD30_00260 [Ureibacillus massiliensis 4400831 = CIP 108448 = CCUG 49529]|uniref:ABC transmembrane type-1 domain-containing protein n=1 Tax=Ureibacillus massiliensis 4400831 = CIP 108448 = CCUG 49529 TaxID=1211035 RepID=A0A0A3J5L5_9BACL|nr:ABC transporter permease [Ureibacillus massiliensis]KGR92299.1 hypothetical protein CD30_00260 [Ureibacillus massiliensis 4400831 = CIP 108448 = CCUG 49529]